MPCQDFDNGVAHSSGSGRSRGRGNGGARRSAVRDGGIGLGDKTSRSGGNWHRNSSPPNAFAGIHLIINSKKKKKKPHCNVHQL